MRFVGFIGPSYTAFSPNVDCQRCMNLYPEVDPLGTGKEHEIASLVPSPGLTLQVTLGDSPIRGLWTASNGTLYAVAGKTVYSISSSYVATSLGTIFTTTGYISMADNGTYLVFVDGTDGWAIQLSTNTLTQITDSNFSAADQVTFQDTFFIFNKHGSQKFFCSDSNAITFTGTNTASKEGSPDNLVGLISSQENLYLFGSQSMEVWYDAGGSPCPFSRVYGASIRVGCSALWSIARIQSTIYWLGGDETGTGIIYALGGSAPQRISTPSIESIIRAAGATNIANAKAWTYQQGGHVFYCISVPTVNSTWCYDTSTGLWHERTYLGSWSYERHRADFAVVAYNANVVGDYANGNIYTLDPANYTDNGTSIVRLRAAPHLSQSLDRVFHSRFQLDMETGVGITSGQGSAPNVMLQWSDDGGHTWSNEHWAAAGALGNTKTRVIWRRLGSSRDRVYRVIISDPVKVTLIGAEIDAEAGVA